MGIPKKRILNQRAMVFWIYMMIYLLLHIYKQVGVLVGLTPKELNWVMHMAKQFKWEGNSLLRVWIDG
jgi:hypothetical protein